MSHDKTSIRPNMEMEFAFRQFEREQKRADADRRRKWDLYWLKKAREYALECSKDPSTKCGAVIIGPDNEPVSWGYNGFARGVNDDPARYADRETKYKMVVHCEVNAILFADRWRLKGATLYTWPFMCCSNCAAIVINAGIRRCVAPPIPPDQETRWGESVRLSKAQFSEAGVRLDIMELPQAA